jgi:hypothetical protein
MLTRHRIIHRSGGPNNFELFQAILRANIAWEREALTVFPFRFA